MRSNRNLTVTITAPTLPERNDDAPAFDVVCRKDGTLAVIADPEAFARVGGRDIFGDPDTARAALLERIADAWYAAGCPR